MIRARWLLLVGLLAMSSTAMGADDTELKVFRLQHQNAETLIPTLRPLVSPAGAISGRGDRLLVRDTPNRIAQIAEAVAALDVPVRQLIITVRYTSASEPPPVSGANEIVRHYGTGNDTGEQSITVLDGRTAFVRVGTELSDVHYFLELAGDRLVVAPDVRYRSVTTGFVVTPHLHRDGVELDIMPRLSFTTQRGARTVVFHELASRIKARLGHWVRLGGSGTATTSDVGQGILRHWRTDAPAARAVWVKVESPRP